MKKKIQYEFTLVTNVILGKLLDEYNKKEVKNDLFLSFLQSVNDKNDTFVLNLNINQSKNIVLIRYIFSTISYLSIQLKEELILKITIPIYNLVDNKTIKNKYRKYPIDYLDYNFVFNNGFNCVKKPFNYDLFKNNKKFYFKLFLNSLKITPIIPIGTFYDCNIPEKKDNYNLIEISEDLWEYRKIIK